MLKLVIAPNNTLTTSANDWQFLTDDDFIQADNIEKEMLVIMKQNNGIGLAANQVGLLKRVFVISLSTGQELAMFNPKIIRSSETLQDGQEGCLSFPELWLTVARPQSIEAGYVDKNNKECKITLTDIDARCFLHELDHLNGICFTEKISPLKLALAKKKLHKKRKYA